MNVRRFRFTLECTLKHLLRRHILASVELNHTAVVKRVGITWQNTLGSQTRFSNREIGASTRRDFRDLRVLVYQDSKLITGFSEPASNEFLVRAFKCDKSRRLILRRWTRRWWRRRGSNSSDRRKLLRLFDPSINLRQRLLSLRLASDWLRCSLLCLNG